MRRLVSIQLIAAVDFPADVTVEEVDRRADQMAAEVSQLLSASVRVGDIHRIERAEGW